ncbi:DUF3667 domain-containing protein [Flavobacterium sp. RHBU_3]|uniref:DUF3667 domain-containing protein n=1 Tax=Flavobacterium sp. RHBU_3 TaxID=3391184 RepID=UPI00398553E7
MAHDKLRDDTECQNCGHQVLEIYCPHCGQKNTETRQSFAHLVGHFAEDLTHYDGAFWKTIKYLIFRPGKLTVEYLEGKRQLYVPPVKLYIFVSFITFLLIGIMPEKEAENEGAKSNFIAVNKLGDIEINGEGLDEKKKNEYTLTSGEKVNSIKKLDSLHAIPGKVTDLEYTFTKKVIEIENGTISTEEIGEAFMHTLPKVLFIYMPIFAFWLWLFHSKKRWLFFDHSIFTLHYFALLLLLSCITTIINRLTSYLGQSINEITTLLAPIILFCYSFFYFFRAHIYMYGGRKFISRLKGLILFFINLVCIITVLLCAVYYVIFTLH